MTRQSVPLNRIWLAALRRGLTRFREKAGRAFAAGASRGERAASIEQELATLLPPRALVGERELVQVFRSAARIVDPLAQEIAAVQQVDREAVVLVFVDELAPERILRFERAQRLERERLQAPRPKGRVRIEIVVDVNLHARAQLADVLLESRLEPARPQRAALEPIRLELAHASDQRDRIDV